MNEPTFQQCLKAIEYCHKKNYQKEVWLHGLGESSLHPDFIGWMKEARNHLPYMEIKVSSNAIPLTQEMIDTMKQMKIKLHISLHVASVAAKQVWMAKDAGILEFIGANPIMQTNDWAGQIDLPTYSKSRNCGWLEYGWGYVHWDGQISACCNDGMKKYPQLTIEEFNRSPQTAKLSSYQLCTTCRDFIPNENKNLN